MNNKLELEIRFTQEKRYRINIDRQHNLLFKSNRYVKKWLTRFKNLLQDNVIQLNHFYDSLHSAYRQNYFLINNVDNEKIVREVNNLNERFNFIFQKFGEGNQNQYVIRNIKQINYLLIDFALTLKDIATRYKLNTLKYQIKPILKSLHELEERIEQDCVSLEINDKYLDLTKTTMKIAFSQNA